MVLNANSIFIEDGFSNEDSSRGSANTLAPAAAVIRTKFTKCIIFLEISNYHAIDTVGFLLVLLLLECKRAFMHFFETVALRQT